MRADHSHADLAPLTVRLPGLPDDGIGLGDALKRLTAAVGIKPCSRCERRARALNERVRLTGRADGGGSQ